MAHKSAAFDVDPKEVERAQDMWASFTALIKWSTVATVVSMILLAAVLL